MQYKAHFIQNSIVILLTIFQNGNDTGHGLSLTVYLFEKTQIDTFEKILLHFRPTIKVVENQIENVTSLHWNLGKIINRRAMLS